MFKAIKEFFVGKPVEVSPAAPYKAEPVVTPDVQENKLVEATVELAPAVVAATADTNVSRFATWANS